MDQDTTAVEKLAHYTHRSQGRGHLGKHQVSQERRNKGKCRVSTGRNGKAG